MSFVSIDASQKIAAVKRYWETNNIRQTAQEFQISRSTLYEWIRLVETHLEKVFETSKPGRRSSTPEEQNEKLLAQLQDVLDLYHNTSQRPPGPLPPAVAQCPDCRQTTLVRNGRVQTHRDGLRQRLWCRRCRRSIYVDVKKTL